MRRIWKPHASSSSPTIRSSSTNCTTLSGSYVHPLQNMQRRGHQEFIRFLKAVERKFRPARAWVNRHQRFTLHFTPTCS
ncbi:hypothetical protein [Mesorhizobium sp. M0843]|uniref:hypothetical protein n=1 Tax=Mesorhizobium sp. M0843 TaxID=2957010 RepID=UPI00333728DF